MISVVTWKWHTPGYHSVFTAAHVNALARMVGRHYQAPHRVLCVTNDPAGIDSEISIIPDREDFNRLGSPHGAAFPSCYRRLRLFHPDAVQWFGERFVSIDLDCVIMGDLRPLWNRPEDYVGWADPCRPTQYCGSMTLLRAGSRPQVWTTFDPGLSPRNAVNGGCLGSDQGWVSYCLGPGEAQWTRANGVYSFRFDLGAGAKPLPADARIVMFHGAHDPWGPVAQALPWVREHYPWHGFVATSGAT